MTQTLPCRGRPSEPRWTRKAPRAGRDLWAHEAGAHLAGSLDVEVVKPLQDGNPGHHADGHVAEVAVQHLHNPVEVEGDRDPLSAGGETEELRPLQPSPASPAPPAPPRTLRTTSCLLSWRRAQTAHTVARPYLSLLETTPGGRGPGCWVPTHSPFS